MSFAVSAFYKFVTVTDCEALRDAVFNRATDSGLKGTVLIAREGINATISGAPHEIDEFLAWLRRDPRFADLESKQSSAEAAPFRRLKVKIKPEIVTFGFPEADPSAGVGTYIAPEDWNAVISDPDVIVVDTRNDYEIAIGTFENARDPQTRVFSDFPAYADGDLAANKSRRIAMFCTGGIRCEKATAYLIQKGFTDVVHLKGGILKYLEVVPEESSLWRGGCFVFDERVALEHGLSEGRHTLCRVCGFPIPETNSDEAGGKRAACAKCRADGRDL